MAFQTPNRPFDEWLAATYPSEGERANYRETHLIPGEVPLMLASFREFFMHRRDLMAERLLGALGRGPREGGETPSLTLPGWEGTGG